MGSPSKIIDKSIFSSIFFSAKFYSVYCQYFFLSKSYDNRKSKLLDCLRFIIHDSISFTIIIINIVLRHYYSSSVYSLIFCWSSSDKDGWLFYYLKNPFLSSIFNVLFISNTFNGRLGKTIKWQRTLFWWWNNQHSTNSTANSYLIINLYLIRYQLFWIKKS